MLDNMNNPRPIISKIEKDDLDECEKMLEKVFSIYLPDVVDYVMSLSDMDLSVKLTLGDEIVGLYFLSHERQILHLYDKTFQGKTGLEGVALLVSDNYRGLGFGDILKSYSESLNYDYVWGMQLKSLKNVHHWMKRRTHFFEFEDCYITAKLK
jgi:hypothetical protein